MKRLIFLFGATLSLAACTQTTDKSRDAVNSSDSVSHRTEVGNETMVRTLCFQKLAGTANQDTTFLKLIIEGKKITGDFGHYPKEKDKRVGKINNKLIHELDG